MTEGTGHSLWLNLPFTHFKNSYPVKGDSNENLNLFHYDYFFLLIANRCHKSEIFFYIISIQFKSAWIILDKFASILIDVSILRFSFDSTSKHFHPLCTEIVPFISTLQTQKHKKYFAQNNVLLHEIQKEKKARIH